MVAADLLSSKMESILNVRLRPVVLFCLVVSASLAAAGKARAQKLPPVQPPAPMPTRGSTPTITSITREVLVPTLVERHGHVIYDLQQKDFTLDDNGVPQKIHVQRYMDTAPVAMVVAVELGGASVLEFGKVAQMGPLLSLFLTDQRSKAALVGFDSTQHLICDFTHSGSRLNHALDNLQPGDGGDAILDTVSYAVNLLDTEPQYYRRVLLLISEERDHGSKHTRIEDLIRQIGRSDVLVLSVAFTPAEAELAHDVTTSGNDRMMNLPSALFMLVQAFKKNVAKEIAVMSGGEYTHFSGNRRFQERVVTAARDMRNRYLISFSPSNPTPGLHTIKVNTVEDYGAKIVARTNYWIGKGP